MQQIMKIKRDVSRSLWRHNVFIKMNTFQHYAIGRNLSNMEHLLMIKGDGEKIPMKEKHFFLLLSTMNGS